jgi:YidC/Oxa1 family membrane protein insertase
VLSPNIFTTVFVFPILNVLIGLYKIFLSIHLPGAFGFAIISLVVLVRFLLHPFFKQQMETARKMQDIKPHLDKLSVKHKGNPKQLQAEQMKLYQEAGINPAAGCIFMIIQIPVFIALYNTLSLFLSHGTGAKMIAEVNNALYAPFLKISTIDLNFVGFNLALSPSKAGIWYYYLIPVITAIFQYYQAVASMPSTPKTPVVVDGKEDDKDKKTNTAQDFQSAMNTQMKYIFPLMIGYFSYTLPVGLSLYWNIFSIFSIMQYRMMKSQAKRREETKLKELQSK